MGFREAVLFVFVFLLSGGNLCAATQNWSNSSTNETLNRTSQEQEASVRELPRPPQPTDHRSNRTEHGDPVGFPVSYRLKIYQLRKKKPLQPLAERTPTVQNLQGSEAGELTSEQLEPRETAPAPELLKLPIQGPDLNPPVRQESKVLFIFMTFAAFLIFCTISLHCNWVWMTLQVLVTFEPRVPAPAVSAAVRCGDAEVTVEVKRNFLGNAAGCLFELIHCEEGGFVRRGTSTGPFNMPSALMSEKRMGQVRGPNWKIEWDGEDGTLSADYCKWHRLWAWRSILCFLLFLHSEKEHSACLFGAQALTLQRCIKRPFYLSCGWTSTCCERYWPEQEKKWPQVMGLIQAAPFPLCS